MCSVWSRSGGAGAETLVEGPRGVHGQHGASCPCAQHTTLLLGKSPNFNRGTMTWAKLSLRS